jgi:NodT family efflux transporter outer membrane factor (OMF) lipoprotein
MIIAPIDRFPTRLLRQGVSLAAIGLVLAGCAVGPNYARPTAPTPMAFKEAEGWAPAKPADSVELRGQWWTLFNDPVLNDLEAKVEVSNQNLKAAEAAYRVARAVLDEQSSTIFPTVNLTGSDIRSKSASAAPTGAPTTSTTAGRTVTQYSAKIGATWDVDVWGRIRRQIEASRATYEASGADLANAKLSAQVLLAVDYIQLRMADEQKRLIDLTVKGYADNLRIAQNRYNVGVGARADLLSAQTQLKTAQASAVDLLRTRAQYEHAIAVLTGQAPADLSLTQAAWTLTVPAVPVGLPSTLLERRPDIAGAERRMAAANAQIGVNIAGFFPDISVSGTDGFSSTSLSKLFAAANNSWSLGANLAQTIFDAGLTSAKVRAARATYDQQVANYRQVVLTAFQQVEDNIAALRVLESEYDLTLAASQNADEAEKIVNNQYQAGQVDFTTVVVAQNTALAARRTLIQTAGNRMVALTSLVSALGGGWQSSQLAQK